MEGLYALILVVQNSTTVIGGYAGPLPYGVEECQRRIVEMQTEIETSPEGMYIIPGREDDISFTCEFLLEEPVHGNEFP